MQDRRLLSQLGLVGLVLVGGMLQVLLFEGLRQVARDIRAVQFVLEGARRPPAPRAFAARTNSPPELDRKVIDALIKDMRPEFGSTGYMHAMMMHDGRRPLLGGR